MVIAGFSPPTLDIAETISPYTSSSVTPAAIVFARCCQPDIRDRRGLLEIVDLRRRLQPTNLSEHVAAIHDPASSVLECRPESRADRRIRPVAVQLQTNGAPEPTLRPELVDDEPDAVASVPHRKDPDVVGAGHEPTHQSLARGIEQDEPVGVGPNRYAARWRPLLRTLGLVPLTRVSAHIEEALGSRQPEQVDGIVRHAGTNPVESMAVLLTREREVARWAEVVEHMITVASHRSSTRAVVRSHSP